MTALDKAFIKAYQQTGAPPKPTPLGTAAPVPLREALAQLPAEPPKPRGPSRSKVLSTLASPAARSAGPTGKAKGKRGEKTVRSEPKQEAKPAAKGELSSLGVSRASAQEPASRLPIETLGIAILPLPAEPAEPVAHDVPAARNAPAELNPPPAAEPPAAPKEEAGEPPAQEKPGALRPMLQVDSFAWPAVCTRLTPAAAAQIDRLALGLIGGDGARPRVIAVVGSGRGAGCTTLLLGAARRLAARGMKLALVDADSADPALATRLGLAPEFGWEEVVAGRLPLPEVLIESLEDRLALLPRCRRAADGGSSWPAAHVGPLLERLRPCYDLVLADAGTIEAGADPPWMLGGWLDAVVVVHNVRGGRADALARTRHRLAAAGVPLLGVAENFAAAETYRRAA